MPAINIIHKTLLSILSKDFLSLLIKSTTITALTLLIFIGSITYILISIPIPFTWLDNKIDSLITSGGYAFGWFLFPLCMPILASVFRQKTIAITENEYPLKHPRTRDKPINTLGYSLLFLLKTLLLNILCLPLYLIPAVNITTYYLLNSYLLGREFFNNVSSEFVKNKEIRKLRKQNKLICISAGLFILVISNIPIINLITPILGTCLMVHVFYNVYEK